MHRLTLSAFLLALVATVATAELPKEGEPAPAIDLPATNIGSILPDKKDKKTLSLLDVKGKNVVRLLTITSKADRMG